MQNRSGNWMRFYKVCEHRWRRNYPFIKSFDLIIKNNVILLFEVLKNIQSKDPKVVKTINRKIMLSLDCAMCCSKKLRFIKEQEASGLLFRT